MMELAPGLPPPLLLNEVRGVVVADEGDSTAATLVGVSVAARGICVVGVARLSVSATTASREGVCERDALFEVDGREMGLEVREWLRKSSMGISSELELNIN